MLEIPSHIPIDVVLSQHVNTSALAWTWLFHVSSYMSVVIFKQSPNSEPIAYETFSQAYYQDKFQETLEISLNTFHKYKQSHENGLKTFLYANDRPEGISGHPAHLFYLPYFRHPGHGDQQTWFSGSICGAIIHGDAHGGILVSELVDHKPRTADSDPNASYRLPSSIGYYKRRGPWYYAAYSPRRYKKNKLYDKIRLMLRFIIPLEKNSFARWRHCLCYKPKRGFSFYARWVSRAATFNVENNEIKARQP